MNLIFRMLFVIIRSFFCERMAVGNFTSELSMHVLPNDIDINFHMNNGRYLTICDHNRVDILARGVGVVGLDDAIAAVEQDKSK